MVKFKLPFSQIRDSFKEIKLNLILDKVSKKISLSEREKLFLKNYENELVEEYKDYKLLSKENIVERVKYIISKKKIICNLEDKDGRINSQIISINNNFQGDCQLVLKNNVVYELGDNFLYNLIYNNKKDLYSLESEDEFYEKIESK
jgi:hypothetical protein